MRFIAISRAATEEIIADRRLQSIEYEYGRAFALVLQNPKLEANLTPRVSFVHHAEGLFVVSHATRSPDYVIFDLQMCDLFSSKAHQPADVLLYVQKVLRFATKIWGNLKLSA